MGTKSSRCEACHRLGYWGSKYCSDECRIRDEHGKEVEQFVLKEAGVMNREAYYTLMDRAEERLFD